MPSKHLPAPRKPWDKRTFRPAEIKHVHKSNLLSVTRREYTMWANQINGIHNISVRQKIGFPEAAHRYFRKRASRVNSQYVGFLIGLYEKLLRLKAKKFLIKHPLPAGFRSPQLTKKPMH